MKQIGTINYNSSIHNLPVLLVQNHCPSCPVIRVLLRNLSIDYVEITIIRLDDDDNPIEDDLYMVDSEGTALAAALEMRKQGIGFPAISHDGKIRVIGNSERILMQVLRELELIPHIPRVQPHYTSTFDHAGI